MGNVFAASKPPTDVGFLGFLGIDLPPASQGKQDIVGIHNPGTLEELHKSTREIFPTTFNGARVILRNRVSNHLQVYHNVTLTRQPGTYRFGATYNGANQAWVGEVYPTLVGEMDASGNLSANVLHQIGNRLGLKFQTQMNNRQISSAELRADYRGDRYTCSLAVSNPDLLNDFQGVFVARTLLNFTNRLALGLEIACQRSDRIPDGHLVVASLSARYTGDDFVASGTVGATTLNLCYYQRASEQLRFGVETETNVFLGESVARIGYRVDLPDIQFRGSLDTNMNAAAALEKKLDPMPFTLTLSGHLDPKKNDFRLGLGVIGVIN